MKEENLRFADNLSSPIYQSATGGQYFETVEKLLIVLSFLSFFSWACSNINYTDYCFVMTLIS